MSNCVDCPANLVSDLKRFGDDAKDADFIVALAGNPNVGKSTIFNNLTGLHQHTGNWPGKTVTRAEGAFGYKDKKFKVIDLPGTYSLLSTSTDEEVARDFILFGKPDVTLVVVDSTKLERNLNLVLQILEITDKVVVALNLVDELKRKNIKLDSRRLSADLGIPAVPLVARTREGMKELIDYVWQVASGEYVCKPKRIKKFNSKVEHYINELTKDVKKTFPNLPNARWIAMRLLEGDQQIIDAIKNGELGRLFV
jgi:small GTP-binding protein